MISLSLAAPKATPPDEPRSASAARPCPERRRRMRKTHAVHGEPRQRRAPQAERAGTERAPRPPDPLICPLGSSRQVGHATGTRQPRRTAKRQAQRRDLREPRPDRWDTAENAASSVSSMPVIVAPASLLMPSGAR